MNTPNLSAGAKAMDDTNLNSSTSGGSTGRKIPAGLVDQNAELFYDGNALKGTFNGQTKSFDELPSIVKLHFGVLYSKAIEQDSQCEIMILKHFKPCNYSEELEQFVKCNYGGFDNKPDFVLQKNPAKEYWNCGHRGNCPAEGIVCKPDCICNNNLSVRETEVIKHIADGKLSKEIAEAIDISIHTVHTHEQSIHKKLGDNIRRGDIIKFAYQNNILL